MTPQLAILAFITAQRLGELLLARANTARLMSRGAVELAPEHYPLIVAMHAAWLAGLWILAPSRDIHIGWLLVFAGLQGLRLWVLLTLRSRWTTRIIVLPGAPLIGGGPYRFVKHPNYCVVAAEILVAPLMFGLVGFAVVFSLLNAAVLAIRIRAENRALAG